MQTHTEWNNSMENYTNSDQTRTQQYRKPYKMNKKNIKHVEKHIKLKKHTKIQKKQQI